MPSPYIQLLLVNMLLAALIATQVLGAPVAPAVVGALAAGALLYVRYRLRKRRGEAALMPLSDREDAPRSDLASAGREGSGIAPVAPPTPAAKV